MLVDELKRLMMSRTQAWLLALNQNGCEAKAEVAMRWLANKVADSHREGSACRLSVPGLHMSLPTYLLTYPVLSKILDVGISTPWIKT